MQAEQTADVVFGEAANRPVGHAKHADVVIDGWFQPLGQSWHTCAFSYLPAAHAKHDFPPMPLC